MKRKIQLGLLFILTIMMTNLLCAATASNPKAQALIKKLTQDQLSIEQTFDGPANLVGFVLKPDVGTPIIMYADQNGEYVIYGSVFGSDGESISSDDTKKYVDAAIAKKLFTNIDTVTSFTQGKEDAQYSMYVVADPNCTACHILYDVMQPAIKKGELKVKWVLVYFVQESSQGKAAAILAAKDPAVAFEMNEGAFKDDTEAGGIQPLAKIPSDLMKKLKANMNYFKTNGLTSTPTMIYRNSAGEPQFLSGVPSDIDTFLKKEAPSIHQQS